MFSCLMGFRAKLVSKYVFSSGTRNIFSNIRRDVSRSEALRHNKTSDRQLTHNVQPVQDDARLHWSI